MEEGRWAGERAHHGELAAAEGKVCVLEVEGADALLQREQALVDVGTLHARLPVIIGRVRRALATGQIDEAELA